MAAQYGYIGNNPANTPVVIAKQRFEPTGIQTTFTFAAGYRVGYLDLYLNGSRLIEALDYTATDGSTVDLISAAQNGDVLELIAYKAFNVAGVSTVSSTTIASDTYWQQNATGINTTSNVGIGTTTASSALTVQGGVSVSGVSTFSSDVRVATLGNGKLSVGPQPTDLYLEWNESGQVASLETSATGNLYVQNGANGGIFLNAGTSNQAGVHLYPSDRVELRHAASKKFETTGSGVNITGVCTATSFSGDGSQLTGLPEGMTVLKAMLFS
jgi:hypothetical protein